MANTFIIQIILTVVSCGLSSNAEQRIVGGHEAAPDFGLFHASLQNWMGIHVCGGAIVSKLHVVTAAHCVLNAEPEHIKVIVGTTNLNNGGMSHDTASVNICNSFNYTAKVNDIAVLRVTESFDFNYVHSIPLREEPLIEGDIVFLSGFGAQVANGESSTQMHVLTIPVFNQETCEFAMRYTREVTVNMFCTFTKIGQGTCNGDSGSPIIKDDQLVGVVSWGIPCAVGFPDVHTRVAPFVSWIKNLVRNDICGIPGENFGYSKSRKNKTF